MPTLNLDDALYQRLSALAAARKMSIESCIAALIRTPEPVLQTTSNGHPPSVSETCHQDMVEFSTDYAFALHVSADQQITVTWITESFKHITGFEPETVQPFDIFMRVIHPRDRGKVEASLTQALAAGEDTALSYRILTRDGAIRYIDGVFRPQPTKQHMGHVLGVAHDVTDRVTVEHQLQARLRQQAALAEISQAALAATSFDTLLDRVVSVVADTLNTEFTLIGQLLPNTQTLLLRAGSGWPPGEIGQRHFDLQREVTNDCMLLVDDSTPSLCRKSRFCSLSLLRDYDIQSGVSVFIPNNGDLFGVLGAHTHHLREFTDDDINFLQSIANLLGSYLARAATQDALKRSEEKFRKLLESASEGILLIDHHGRIILINRIAQEIFGYSQAELADQPINTLLPPDLRERHDQHFADYMAAPSVRPMGQGRELYGQRKDGSQFPIEVSLSFVEIEDNRLIICFVVDITERRQLEQQRIDTAKMMIELEKERELLNLKEQFMSMITHEFRSPLAAISSSCQIIEHYYERLDDEQLLTRIGNIDARANQMAEMIDDVLTLTRAGMNMLEYNPAPVNLPDFCHDLVTNAQLTDPGHHQFTLQIDDGLDTVQADARLMGHIFNNLLNNAAKYSPSGSTIHFSVRNGGGDLRFDVRDEGIGIPAEDQKRLFKPFYRASNVGAINGSGLGLAVVKVCVEAHGGSLEVHSSASTGTTFTIFLPLAW